MRKSLRTIGFTVAWMACFGWLLPVPDGFASDAAPQAGAARRPVADVRVDKEGTLRGKLVDPSGQPLQDRVIALQRDQQVLGSVKTNEQGEFVFPRVRGGVYQMRVKDRAVQCRVWPRNVAPPAARARLLIVTGDPVVRGQQPIGAIFSNPLFIGAVLAAAIAIPIAVHNAQDDEPSGS